MISFAVSLLKYEVIITEFQWEDLDLVYLQKIMGAIFWEIDSVHIWNK